MYVRFETRNGVGLFHEAARAQRTIRPGSPPMIRRSVRDEFMSLKNWLWDHVEPPRARVYRDPDGRRLITWFRCDAREHVVKAWRLYELLSAAGSTLRPIHAKRPGVVVFEDAVQAVVAPFRAGGAGDRRRGPNPRSFDDWEDEWSEPMARPARTEVIECRRTLTIRAHTR